MSRNKRRYVAWAALGLLTGALAVAAAGCGGGSSSKSASSTSTTSGPSSIGKGEKASNRRYPRSWAARAAFTKAVGLSNSAITP